MLLNVEGLTKKYVRGGVEFAAVDDVSFSLNEGEFVSVIGHSGCGKSTLFSVIAGLVEPTSGNVTFDGVEFFSLSDNEKAQCRNTKLGYILQGQNLLQNFTVIENICMPLSLGKTGIDNAKIEDVLETFGLTNVAKEYPVNLSGGEQRRVSIARTLVHSPKLIIADEPTSNLDPTNSQIIIDAFRKACREGATVLMSSHNIALADTADRQFKMANGKLSL
ncbi:MAG: ABC transporter ATP-binding protein [Dehalococcoidales bacterium]|nr:ABC transporter ATP-binding protein [Dehalococcoidales bacterium]